MQDVTGVETFSPTLKMVTFRLLFAVAAYMGWIVQQMDVCNAFLNADLPEHAPVYMAIPKGFENEFKGHIIRLRKALYGLKNSPRQWFLALRHFLTKVAGLTPSVLDPCLFILVNASGCIEMLVGCHVDDLIIVGVSAAVHWFKQLIHDQYKMDDLGMPTRCLGADITFHPDGAISLHAERYIDKVLKRFQLNTADHKGYTTPMDPSLKLTKEDESKLGEKVGFPYREAVACCLFLSILIRPDICFAVKELSRFLERPGEKMVRALKRLLRYLGRTKKLHLRYRHQISSFLGGLFKSGEFPQFEHVPIHGFSDSDYAGQDDRRSTGGMFIMFCGAALMWWCRIIRTVALSSQDAEFMALSDTSREVLYVQNLLLEIGFLEEDTTLPIFGDNRGAISLANTPGCTQKSKHLDVRYFFVQQKVEEGRISVHWVVTTEQLADLLTKALAYHQHMRFTLAAMGLPEDFKY